MKRCTTRDMEASLRWRSTDADHCERRFFAAFDPGLDILPSGFGPCVADLGPGEGASRAIGPGDGWIAADPSLHRRIRRDQFRRIEVRGAPIEPRIGRFYPRSLLAEVADVHHGDRRPFRVTALDAEALEVDLNHPLAGRTLRLEVRVAGSAAAAGPCRTTGRNIVALLAADGPGMQAGLPGTATDYYADQPYQRGDESDDPLFYARIRMVPHLDATALQRLTLRYAPFLSPGMAVLDLMSSWDSHLPESMPNLEVTGLGLNATELESNSRLARRVVHDLNREPRLPFPDACFDAVLCSLSVEYLTHPLDVWREVARVLRADAPFVLSFSERWFPPKAVRIWSELHAFERVGLVLDHFRRSAAFAHLATESLQGLPRPPEDKYNRLTPLSDPVHLVWGRRVPEPDRGHDCRQSPALHRSSGPAVGK